MWRTDTNPPTHDPVSVTYRPRLQTSSDPGSKGDLFLWPSAAARLKKLHHITPVQIEVTLTHINTTPAHAHKRQIQTRVIVFADDRGKGVRPNVYPKRNWPLLISSIPIQDSDTVTISHSQPV